MTLHSHFPATDALAPLFAAAVRPAVPVETGPVAPAVSEPFAGPVPSGGQFDSICALIRQIMGVASVALSIGGTQVTGEAGVFAAHLEVPLVMDGRAIGALRALDRAPRDFAEADRAMLEGFAKLAVEQYALWQQASRDALTGAMTRRAFTESLDKALARARRTDEPLSVILFDLDHFKSINDTHGHAAGDAVLRTVGKVIAAELRTDDSFGRIGGEEFAVVVQADTTAALEIAERLRRSVALASIDGFADLGATASFGIARADSATASPDMLLAAADAALYAAKSAGRNCVQLAGDRAAKRALVN